MLATSGLAACLPEALEYVAPTATGNGGAAGRGGSEAGTSSGGRDGAAAAGTAGSGGIAAGGTSGASGGAGRAAGAAGSAGQSGTGAASGAAGAGAAGGAGIAGAAGLAGAAGAAGAGSSSGSGGAGGIGSGGKGGAAGASGFAGTGAGGLAGTGGTGGAGAGGSGGQPACLEGKKSCAGDTLLFCSGGAVEPLATCEKGCNPILLGCNTVCRALARTCNSATTYTACLDTGNGTAPGACEEGTFCNDALDACTECVVDADCQTAAALEAKDLVLPCIETLPTCRPNGTCRKLTASDYVAAGVEVTLPGDCLKRTCNGAGQGALLVDDTDLPALDECAPSARCSGGKPIAAPRFRGAICNGGNGRCDGIAACQGAKSCEGMSAGGTVRGKEMCALAKVTGGGFQLLLAQTVDETALVLPHVVSDFWIDRYEVTIGRFRRFLADYDAYRAAGEPAAMASFDTALHPYSDGDPCIGWNQHDYAPGCAAALADRVETQTTTWSSEPAFSANGYPFDEWPVAGGLPWSLAQLFCIWDGGRLPTYAESFYLKARGAEQRDAPWLTPPKTMADALATDASWSSKRGVGASGPDPETVTYFFPCLVGGLCAQGFPEIIVDYKGASPVFRDLLTGITSVPVFDLAGSVTEWALDARTTAPFSTTPCVDCVRSVPWKITNGKVSTGYAWNDTLSPAVAASWKRQGDGLCAEGNGNVGFRCAYTDRGDERTLAPAACLTAHSAAAPGIDCDGPMTAALCP